MMNLKLSIEKLLSVKTMDFKEKFRTKVTAFTRKRKLQIEDCIMILLNKKSRNMQTELDEYFEIKGAEGVSRQGFAKARENLLPEGILALNKSIIDDFEVQNTDKKLFKNHRIFSVDGSYIALPNSKQALEEYGFSTNQNEQKRAKALAMTIYDSLNKLTIHAALFKKNDAEKVRIFDFVAYLKEQNYSNTILALDRGYPSFKLMDYIQKNEYKYAIRVQSNFSKITSAATSPDSQVTAQFKENGIKKTVNFRVVNIQLSSGITQKLVTNLGEEFSIDDIKYIYQKRWGIETSFDVLKNKICLESFTGETKYAILQDFYAAIIIQNMASFAYQEQTKIIKSHPKKQPNMTKIIGDIKKNLIKVFLTGCAFKKAFHALFVKKHILKYAVSSLPNRTFKCSLDHRTKSLKFAKKSPF